MVNFVMLLLCNQKLAQQFATLEFLTVINLEDKLYEQFEVPSHGSKVIPSSIAFILLLKYITRITRPFHYVHDCCPHISH